jgi:Ribbon-helix-helix protein, copG family
MSEKRRGPRGGTTVFTPGGLQKKNFYLDTEEVRALRKRAFDEERSESDIAREALRLYLGLDKKR